MLVAASGGVWNSELAKDRHELVHWLWDGMLAPGAMTLLSGSWKAGKSTLVSLLLDRRRDGGQLLGRTVGAGAPWASWLDNQTRVVENCLRVIFRAVCFRITKRRQSQT